MSKSNLLRIERATTYLVVPHQDKELRFAYPYVGPNNYQAVGKQILEQGLRIPTGDEVVSLLNEVYLGNNDLKSSSKAENIRETMKTNWIWIFNRNLWMPEREKNSGVYIEHDSKALGVSKKMNVSELEDRLSGGTTERGVRFSKDRTVRFAPHNTVKLGEQNTEELAENGFFIASYDADGTENLAKVAKELRYIYVSGVSNNDKAIQSVSALGSLWYGDWLGVIGSNRGGGSCGSAFGVSDSG